MHTHTQLCIGDHADPYKAQASPPQVNKRNLEVKQPHSSASTISTASTDDTDTEKNDLTRFYREAYCPEDVRMLETFAGILQLPQNTGEFVKPVLRSMKLLRLCDYTPEDICCIMAHASVYFRQVYGLCGNDMDANEIGNVAATLLFIAHSYTQDEVCPLKIWHRHLFKKYCSMRLLNAAVFRLLRICRFRLRANDEEIQDAFRRLMVASGTPF